VDRNLAQATLLTQDRKVDHVSRPKTLHLLLEFFPIVEAFPIHGENEIPVSAMFTRGEEGEDEGRGRRQR